MFRGVEDLLGRANRSLKRTKGQHKAKGLDMKQLERAKGELERGWYD